MEPHRWDEACGFNRFLWCKEERRGKEMKGVLLRFGGIVLMREALQRILFYALSIWK